MSLLIPKSASLPQMYDQHCKLRKVMKQKCFKWEHPHPGSRFSESVQQQQQHYISFDGFGKLRFYMCMLLQAGGAKLQMQASWITRGRVDEHPTMQFCEFPTRIRTIITYNHDKRVESLFKIRYKKVWQYQEQYSYLEFTVSSSNISIKPHQTCVYMTSFYQRKWIAEPIW